MEPSSIAIGTLKMVVILGNNMVVIQYHKYYINLFLCTKTILMYNNKKIFLKVYIQKSTWVFKSTT